MASSKKKSSATTMTLKDFHGGNIPSDLPLPSAPGVSVRPPDRPAAARRHPAAVPTPAPAPTPPLLSLSTARIGRNFDEDERTPFEAGPPRRFAAPVSVQPLQPPQVRSAMPNAWGVRKEAGVAQAVAMPTVGSGAGGMWSASRVASASAVEKVISGQWHTKASTMQSGVEDVALGVRGLGVSTRGMAGENEQLGLASDIEREHLPPVRGESVRGWYRQRPEAVWERLRPSLVESERERFRVGAEIERERERPMLVPSQSEMERLRYDAEFDRGLQTRGDLDRERMRYAGDLERERERPRSVGHPALGLGPGSGEKRDLGRPRSPVEGNAMLSRPMSHEGRVSSEASDRPRLKLLPRTRPADLQAANVHENEDKQVYRPPSSNVQLENAHHLQAYTNGSKPTLGEEDAESRAVDRPRLNLKPRSSQTSQTVEGVGNERQSVFGGARPRELVLKERGIDNVMDDFAKISPTSRASGEVLRTDAKLKLASIGSSVDKAGSSQPGQKMIPGYIDRKDYRWDADKPSDMQKPVRRDEPRGTARNVDKPVEQARPEPSTWRKPVEQPKDEAGSGPRFGKIASPLELAQAFSKSSSSSSARSFLSAEIPNALRAPRLRDDKRLSSAAAQQQWRINGY